MRVNASLNSYAYAPGDLVHCVVTVSSGRALVEQGVGVKVEGQLCGLCRGHNDWVELPNTRVVREGQNVMLISTSMVLLHQSSGGGVTESQCNVLCCVAFGGLFFCNDS